MAHLQQDECADGLKLLCPPMIRCDGSIGQDKLVSRTLLKVGYDVREYDFVGSEWILDSSGPFREKFQAISYARQTS